MGTTLRRSRNFEGLREPAKNYLKLWRKGTTALVKLCIIVIYSTLLILYPPSGSRAAALDEEYVSTCKCFGHVSRVVFLVFVRIVA